MLIWGGINFKKYILFVTGIKIKVKIMKSGYQEMGLKKNGCSRNNIHSMK